VQIQDSGRLSLLRDETAAVSEQVLLALLEGLNLLGESENVGDRRDRWQLIDLKERSEETKREVKNKRESARKGVHERTCAAEARRGPRGRA